MVHIHVIPLGRHDSTEKVLYFLLRVVEWFYVNILAKLHGKEERKLLPVGYVLESRTPESLREVDLWVCGAPCSSALWLALFHCRKVYAASSWE